MPRVTVETQTWLPGWALRITAAAAPALLVLLGFSRSGLPSDLRVLAVVVALAIAASMLWRKRAQHASSFGTEYLSTSWLKGALCASRLSARL